MIKETTKVGFTVVLVSTTWKGVRSLKTKGWFADRESAEKLKKQLDDAHDATYRVLGPKQLASLQAEIKAEAAARRAKGAKKAAETRKKRGAAAFVLCPHCQAKSKKLWTEFGGLETRSCQNGHRFEYDRWLADRAFWALVR